MKNQIFQILKTEGIAEKKAGKIAALINDAVRLEDEKKEQNRKMKSGKSLLKKLEQTLDNSIKEFQQSKENPKEEIPEPKEAVK